MDDFELSGPTFSLRLPRLDDAAALFGLAGDPEVTRWFSWGPYETEHGEHLDLVVVHRAAGPIGITGIGEISRRDRRAMLGTWLGREWWGTGANAESKALVAHVAFALLGFERLGAYTNVLHARSQSALRAVGFSREGVLRHYHRHGEAVHDVVVWSILRSEWERSRLHAVSVQVRGQPPSAFLPPG